MQEPWRYEKLLTLGNYMTLNKVPRMKFVEFEETMKSEPESYL